MQIVTIGDLSHVFNYLIDTNLFIENNDSKQ